MSNELVLSADPVSQSGLTVTGEVYTLAGVQQGSDVTMTEVGSTAIYRGDMPSAGAAEYIVRYISLGSMIEQETIFWDGTALITLKTLSDDIASAQGDITTLLSDVSDVETDVASVASQVASLNDLTAQEIRDALALDLTGGVRSIDKKLNAIEAFSARKR